MSPSKSPEAEADAAWAGGAEPRRGGATSGKATRRATLPDWRGLTLRIAALLVVILITVLVYRVRERVDEFAAFGYPGVFLIALLANATVLLPAPGTAVVFAMGGVFQPALVALAAATGGALGELTGYLAGVSGQVVVERARIYERVLPWVRRYGGWAIMVLAAIPNPVFDLAGIAAGVTRLPLWRFLLFCWMGQFLKMTAFAFAGSLSLSWLEKYIH